MVDRKVAMAPIDRLVLQELLLRKWTPMGCRYCEHLQLCFSCKKNYCSGNGRQYEGHSSRQIILPKAIRKQFNYIVHRDRLVVISEEVKRSNRSREGLLAWMCPLGSRSVQSSLDIMVATLRSKYRYNRISLESRSRSSVSAGIPNQKGEMNTIVDLMNNWAEAIPARNHTAPTVAKFIMENIVCRFGTTLRIISDQGREFESALFQELCERLEIDKVRSSPYIMPSTNGVVEPIHRTLN